MGKVIAVSLLGALVCSPPLASANESSDREEQRQVRADCQVEGQAAGLSGRDLEEFTQSCVEELLDAELVNVVE